MRTKDHQHTPTSECSVKALYVIAAVIMCLLASISYVKAEGHRELNLHNVNTNEDLSVIYKRNGVYEEVSLKKLEWFFRDWRRGESRHMDPRLFDLLSQIYEATGSKNPIYVHSGYRSSATNSLLRKTTRGVAERSQHIQGKAIDFHIPGVSAKTLRAIALKFQSGGVGYYPNSRSPFVHIDVASVRAWPRPSRQYLSSLFPDGKTAHIPSDGRPLPRYEEALQEIRSRKLGIMSVIGEIKEFGSKQANALLASRMTAELDNFIPPIPIARPASSEVNPLLANDETGSHYETAYAGQTSTAATRSQTYDPFKSIIAGRLRLLERSKLDEVEEYQDFITVKVEKSGRIGRKTKRIVRKTRD